MSDELTASCAQALRGWSAPDADQERLRVAFVDHLGEQERRAAQEPEPAGPPRPAPGWARECAGAHLTASALICSAESVLLTLHAKLGRWLQTGGHLEAEDSSLAGAAWREATEESGLVGLRLDPIPLLLSRHEVPCGPVRPCFHFDVQYLARADAETPPVFGAESHDVAWFRYDDLPEVDDSVRELVAAARARLLAAPTGDPAAGRRRPVPR